MRQNKHKGSWAHLEYIRPDQDHQFERCQLSYTRFRRAAWFAWQLFIPEKCWTRTTMMWSVLVAGENEFPCMHFASPAIPSMVDFEMCTYHHMLHGILKSWHGAHMSPKICHVLQVTSKETLVCPLHKIFVLRKENSERHLTTPDASLEQVSSAALKDVKEYIYIMPW